MITPRFWLEQDGRFVILRMRLVHMKLKDVQFVVDGHRMTFFSKPYFLRLTFDQRIVESEDAKATYDVETETMTVLIPKETEGEFFTDLDCTTKLLTTTKERKQMVQEVKESSGVEGEGEEDEESSESGDDCELRQVQLDDGDVDPARETHRGGFYGFNEDFTGFFVPTRGEMDVAAIDVDGTPMEQRVQEMRAAEAEKFINGCEQYLFAYKETDDLKQLLSGTLYAPAIHNVDAYGNPQESEEASFRTQGIPRPAYYAEGAMPPTYEYLMALGEAPQTAAGAASAGILKGGTIDADMLDEEFEEEAVAPAAPAPKLKKKLIEVMGEEEEGEEEPASAPAFANPGDIGVVRSGGGLSGVFVTSDQANLWNARQSAVGGYGDVGQVEEDDEGEGLSPSVKLTRNGELSTWEREELLRLPKKSYLVVDEDRVLCGLMDLLAAFCYDYLTTDGEGSPESVWTFTTLSASLAYCVPLPSPRHVVVTFMRRALTYPLYRHTALARRCLHDVAHILSRGSKMLVVRLLLRMKAAIDRDEMKHPLSKLYLAPYATWVQTVSPDALRRAGSSLAASLASTPKEMLGLPLAEVEALADMTEENPLVGAEQQAQEAERPSVL